MKKGAVNVDCSLSQHVLFCTIHECFCIIAGPLCVYLGAGPWQGEVVTKLLPNLDELIIAL